MAPETSLDEQRDLDSLNNQIERKTKLQVKSAKKESKL